MQDIEKLIELAGFKGHPAALGLAELASVSRSPHWQQRLMRLLEPRAALTDEAHPLAPSPGPGELPPGEVHLGKVVYANGGCGADIMLPRSQLTQHLLVSATTGAGKSFYLTDIAAKLMAHKVPIWIVDTEGEYYQRLAGLVAPDQLLYFDLSTFKRNPFEPLPGEDVAAMLSRCRDVFAEALWWGEGAKNVFSQALSACLAERGVLAGGHVYPTVADVLDRALRMRSGFIMRLGEYKASVINRLSSVVELMPCYSCVAAGDFRVDRLIASGKSIIFRVKGGMDVLNLFVKDLLKAASVVLESEPAPGLRLAVFLDECHRFVNTGGHSEFEPILLDLAATFRKRGGTLALMGLTGAALEVLARLEVRPAYVPGRGSLAHRHYQAKGAEWAIANGWEAKIEGGDARADVALAKGGRRVALEVAMDDRHEAINVPADMEEFDEVWVVSQDVQVLARAEQRVRRQLDEEGNRRVRFLVFSEVARELGQGGKQKRHTAGAGGVVAAAPARREERLGRGEVEEKEGEEKEGRNERRGRNRKWLCAQIAQAVRHINDPIALGTLPLARTPAIEKWSRAQFNDHIEWSGLGLQRLIRAATAKILEPLPDDSFTRFAKLYAEGTNVSQAARQIGISREYVSRVHRPRYIALLGEVLKDLFKL